MTASLTVLWVCTGWTDQAAGAAVGLFWDEAGTVNTLAVAEPGTVSAYLVFHDDTYEYIFGDYRGGFFITQGIQLTGIACLTGASCDASLEYPFGDGFPVVHFSDRSCTTTTGSLSIARLDFFVDPGQFTDLGPTEILPAGLEGSSLDTWIAFGESNCQVYWDGRWSGSPAFLVKGSVPTETSSFSGLKATYR